MVTDLMTILRRVHDPELPMLSICDLGIVRRVEEADGHYTVTITPTFSGCPAMRVIEQNIADALREAGVQSFDIVAELSPPWQSSDVSEAGRAALQASGIAVAGDGRGQISCPHCDSGDTETISEFGATACKKFARCLRCHEPFEVFK